MLFLGRAKQVCCQLGRARVVEDVIRKLAAQVQPTLLFVQPGQRLSLRNLLPARLHCEVGLPERDNLLLWIGVLDTQVAGVGRALILFGFATYAGTNRGHCADLSTTVGGSLSTVPRGTDRALDKYVRSKPWTRMIHKGTVIHAARAKIITVSAIIHNP